MGPVTAIPPEVVDFVSGIVREIINPIIGLLFAAALFLFLYGLLMFIVHAGDDAGRTEGKKHLFWGIIGMTIMVSVYGILQVGLATFDIDSGTDFPSEIDTPLHSL